MDSFRVRGYTGKIARIDLSSKRAFYEDIDQYFAETWIGGTGFGAKILYDEASNSVSGSMARNSARFSTRSSNGLTVTSPSSSRRKCAGVLDQGQSAAVFDNFALTGFKAT